MSYGWQDWSAWVIVGLALTYLWRKLGPAPPAAPAQIIPAASLRRRPPQEDAAD